MKVYKDAFTGDELMSDSYKQMAPFGNEDLADVAFEVAGRRVTKGGDCGIARNTEEGEDDGGEEASETVIDIIDGFKLTETGFSKKEYTLYIKGFMKRVENHLASSNPSRVDAFKAGAAKLIKEILTKYDDFQFFMGESTDPEAGLVYSYYPDGSEVPHNIYIKDGLKEEKY